MRDGLAVMDVVKETYRVSRLAISRAFMPTSYLYLFAFLASNFIYFHLSKDWMLLAALINAICLFIGSAMTSLIGSAVAIGIPLPNSFIGIVRERQFWTYMFATLIFWALPLLASIIMFILILPVMGSGVAELSEALTRDGNLSNVWPTFLVVTALPLWAYLYCAVRLSLLMPALAAGEKIALGKAWLRAKGNVLNMFFAFVLAIALFTVAERLVVVLANQIPATFVMVAASIIVFAIAFGQSLVSGVLAGVLYKNLAGE